MIFICTTVLIVTNTLIVWTNAAEFTPLSWDESHVRARAMLELMTLEEKYALVC